MQALQLPFFFALPESPRWLLVKGRLDDAQKLLTKVAKLNKTTSSMDKVAIEKEFAVLRELAVTVRSLTDNFIILIIYTCSNVQKAKETGNVSLNSPTKQYSILDLFSSWKLARTTSMIYFIWFANSLTYYGLSLNTNDFVGDPFVNFFLLGAVEVPAYLACIFLVKKFGHKKVLLVTLIGAGLGCLAAISIDCKF